MKIKITITGEEGESARQIDRAKQEALRLTAFAFGSTRKMQLASSYTSATVTAEGAPHPDDLPEIQL